MNRNVRGVLCTLIGGVLWGFSGACGQYLFTHYDVSSAWLTAVRMLTAGVLLTIFNLCRQKEKAVGILRDKKDAVQLVLFALLGLLFSQYSYLTAISYSNAGTATVLQYLGPAMIMVLVCVTSKRLPTKIETIAVVLAIFGTFLLATHGNISSMVLTKLGLIWGLLAALSLVTYTMLPSKLIPKWGSMIITGYGMLIGGIVISCILRLWSIPVHIGIDGWLAIGGVAILGTLVAYTMYMQGVGDIGPVKASMLASVEPVSATVFSVFWLHTSFVWIDFIGFVCIISTIFLLTKRE